LNKNFKGLTDQEVLNSREEYGSNKMPEKEPETFWQKFLANLNDPMLKLLMVIAVIMIVLFFCGHAEIYEPIGTLIAIFLVATISARTEMASDKEYKKLQDKTEKDTCKVYRNGVVSVIPIDDVVVGDIVLLQSGDKIPADGILIEGDLRVNNSSLNGETEECKKFAAATDFEMATEITGDTFVDKHSLFAGAIVYNGEGHMKVKRVGIGNPEKGHQGTMMGKMALEMNAEEADSPLKIKLAKLAHQISIFGYVGAVVLAIAYMIHFVLQAGSIDAYLALGGMEILKDFISAAQLAIVLIVCAVPEGLPLMISLVLMSNTKTMLEHNVLVRLPIGIETAGGLNILYSDKTGTITKGRLEVVDFIPGNGIQFDPRNKDGKIRDYLNLSICKNTSALFNENSEVIGGNMTDKALLEFMGSTVFNKLKEDKDCVVTKSQGFNSANKFSSSYIESFGKTFYKGAPERLLEKATKYVDNDGSIKELDKDLINDKLDIYAKRAMRLLAFGYSEKPLVEDEINNDLVIIGFAAIRDDVRPEAVEAIKEVQDAGVQVVMITGDRKETAEAIAREAGIIKEETDIVLTSEELGRMSDEEVKKIIPNLRVISRALPTDKSRMVRLSQELNLTTGMTGDGKQKFICGYSK